MQTNTTASERRRYHRVGFHADAQLKFSVGTFPVEILDSSLAGALLKIDSTMTLEEGSIGSLIVRLSDEVQIKMTGDLLSHGDGNYALHRALSELEDDRHLRRLLELNLGDPELMDRDVESLIDEYLHAS